MSDVFVSYKREDEARVAPIVSGLEAAGLSVWWDRHIEGGAGWRQTITEKLDAAKCVIVVWSEASVGAAGAFVHEEAGRAKARGVLLPVAIDPVSPPLGFGEVQALSLVGWQGDVREVRFADVVAAAKAVIAGGPRPRPQAPGRRWRTAVGISTAIAAILAAIGLVADLAGLQEPICRVPGVSRMCGQLGLGGVPSPAEARLWAARASGDCGGLRSYLATYPNGVFAAEAGRRLTAASKVGETSWSAKELRLPITVRAGLHPFLDEAAARADAERRAPEDAALACNGVKSSDNRLLAVSFTVTRWQCRPRDGGHVCGFDGEAVCATEVPSVTVREVCP